MSAQATKTRATYAAHRARRARRAGRAHRQGGRSQEGAVLLVVMLIIMVATTTAAISVANTQTEARGVGRERMAMHARYASEAAMATTIAWIDALGNSEALSNKWREWKAQPAPELRNYGERPITGSFDAQRHDAFRVWLDTQTAQFDTGVMPVSAAAEYSSTGGAGGAGGTAGTAGTGTGGSAGGTPGAPEDYRGSFGPRQAYTPGGYAVDVTDCFEAPPQPGAQEGSETSKQFYCVFTVRGRVVVADTNTRPFSFDGLNISQSVSGAMHDSRTTIRTPTIFVQ